MEGGGSTRKAETLLKDNAGLRMELQESQETVSKLKTMLKQSRLRIKELENERYERMVEEDIEKELKQFQICSPATVKVKRENSEPDLKSTSKEPGKVRNFISGLDSLFKRMSQTKVLEKVQGEKLLYEDLHSTKPFAANIEEIMKEKSLEKCSTEESKLNEFVHEVENVLPKDKQMSKFPTSSSNHVKKEAIKKNTDGKYECGKCGHKHISQMAVRFHVMYKHEGFTWDCKTCSYKACSPYQLKSHMKIKHNVFSFTTGTSSMKETSKKSIKFKKIQQILNGSKQKKARAKKEITAFVFRAEVDSKSFHDRQVAKKLRKKEEKKRKKNDNAAYILDSNQTKTKVDNKLKKTKKKEKKKLGVMKKKTEEKRKGLDLKKLHKIQKEKERRKRKMEAAAASSRQV